MKESIDSTEILNLNINKEISVENDEFKKNPFFNILKLNNKKRKLENKLKQYEIILKNLEIKRVPESEVSLFLNRNYTDNDNYII